MIVWRSITNVPFPNEHAARQADPEGFASFRRGSLDGAPEGVEAIFGIRADGGSEIQSVRADAARVSAAEFREWLRANNMRDRIEEATGEAEAMANRADFTQPTNIDEPRMMAAAEAFEPHAVALMDGEAIEVELLRTGSHRPRMMGGKPHAGPSSLDISEGMIDSLVRGFAAARQADHFVGGAAPVGYEHAEVGAMRDGKIDPADVKRLAATFASVRKRANGDGSYSLMGSFSYTDEGRAKVRSGEFRGFSLVFVPPGMALDAGGRPIPEYVPIGGTLTNRPFVRTMEPVAASESAPVPVPTKEIHQMDIKHLRGPLALSEDATEAEALAALHALTERAAKADVLADELKNITAERDAEREKVAALAERDKTLTLRQAVADGRISKAQEDRYWRVLAALGEDEAHALFPAQTVPTAPIVAASEQPKDGEQTNGDDDFDRTVSLSEQILKDNPGMSEAAAWAQAWDSVTGNTRAEA